MGRESMAVVESSPPSAAPPPGTAVSATSLAPGFRFHPTDEELVSYYLKRKVLGKPVRFDAIGEVDIYKHEPWDLAGSLSFSRCLFIFWVSVWIGFLCEFLDSDLGWVCGLVSWFNSG